MKAVIHDFFVRILLLSRVAWRKEVEDYFVGPSVRPYAAASLIAYRKVFFVKVKTVIHASFSSRDGHGRRTWVLLCPSVRLYVAERLSLIFLWKRETIEHYFVRLYAGCRVP